jgi:hypothetical protein
VEGADLLRERAGQRGRVVAPLAATLAVLVVVLPQAIEAVGFVRYVTSLDTRVQAYQHILQHVSPDATIASEEPYLRLPDEYRIRRWAPLHKRSLEEFAEDNVEILVMSADRDVVEPRETAERRRELRRLYLLQAVFPAGAAGSVGPTLEVRVRPAR